MAPTAARMHLYINDRDFLNDDGRGEPIDMVNTREDGSYVQARITQHISTIIKKELNYPEFDFHSLQHTHATELCEAGVNLN